MNPRIPPVPDDDLTTLRTSLYLVAKKKLSSDLVGNLTQTIMKARRELLGEQPFFAQITAPSTDADAYLPVHPGAAAFYNGTQQSFMDEYGNYIYLGPMILGGIASVLAAAWKFLGIGQPEVRRSVGHALCPGATDTRRQYGGRAIQHRRGN
jgi:NMT1-like family